MSLNKTLDRFFDEIRREAKRNPDFANRLDAVLRGHGSRRDVPEALSEDVARGIPPPLEGEVSPKATEGAAAPVAKQSKPTSQPTAAPKTDAPNPVAIFRGEGEAALIAALEQQGLPALQTMVSEHNLDPGVETGELDRDALAAHILAYAKRRAARDEKLFDY